jgi:hypothetical protein
MQSHCLLTASGIQNRQIHLSQDNCGIWKRLHIRQVVTLNRLNWYIPDQDFSGWINTVPILLIHICKKKITTLKISVKLVIFYIFVQIHLFFSFLYSIAGVMISVLSSSVVDRRSSQIKDYNINDYMYIFSLRTEWWFNTLIITLNGVSAIVSQLLRNVFF